MRWTNDYERVIVDRIRDHTCPLCGGRIKARRRWLGRGRWYTEPVCSSCGMVVGSGEHEHDDS